VIWLANLWTVRKAHPKFLGGHFNYPTVAPNIDWQPFASVFFHDFFNGGF